MVAAVIGSSLVALAIGWITGMWTRTRSDQWCPVDGEKLTCPRCLTAGAHSLGSPANLARRTAAVDSGGAA